MNDMDIAGPLAGLRDELGIELRSIAQWWLDHVVDVGAMDIAAEVSNSNRRNGAAGKGLILTARILWFFSAIHRIEPREDYRLAAKVAYRILSQSFADESYGGMMWTLDRDNQPCSTRKQSYGQAFAIYALTEYYLAIGEDDALRIASGLVDFLETRALDPQYGGYLEAFSRDWKPIADQRLSEKDANVEKSMNTHLHILEAYTNFYRAQPSDVFRRTLQDLTVLFVDRFVRPQGEHLTRFYSRDWRESPAAISFGHDIEASWLIWEAATVLEDDGLLRDVRQPVLDLANGVLARGIDEFGAVSYELLPGGLLDAGRHWWVQAEAMVGFMNAWQITGEVRFLEACRASWQFIKRYQIDRAHGEWRWLSAIDSNAAEHYKAGPWKAPYHNGRAMIELIVRLSTCGATDVTSLESPSTSADDKGRLRRARPRFSGEF